MEKPWSGGIGYIVELETCLKNDRERRNLLPKLPKKLMRVDCCAKPKKASADKKLITKLPEAT
jgi:hypothetical protein